MDMLSHTPHGIISHNNGRKDDYLYRISLKCLIKDTDSQILVVKEPGRDWWDLPGGGMDHGEDIRAAIAREMNEEVMLTGKFTHRIIAIDEPKLLDPHNFWQIRLVFEVTPDQFTFKPGEDGDEVAFIHPTHFKESLKASERFMY